MHSRSGNISEIFAIKWGCRQGDPIFRYLFILRIKILTLAFKNSKAKPYRTKKRNTHLQDQYADDLTIFLEYTNGDVDRNALSIKYVVNVLDEFFVLSGLDINKYKTMPSAFGSSLDKSNLAGSLGLKWCAKFTLLGLDFDQFLGEMEKNFMDVMEKIKKVEKNLHY